MAVTVVSYPNNNMNLTFSLTDVTNSMEAIKNLVLRLSDAGDDKYIEVTFDGSEMITIDLIEECRYEPQVVIYQNKDGAQDNIVFFKDISSSMAVKRSNFLSNKGDVSDGFHHYQDFNINGRETIKLNTGFIEEENSTKIKQLLLSEKVWLLSGFVPLNVKNTNISYKTRRKDRLISYEIEFLMAFDEIQVI